MISAAVIFINVIAVNYLLRIHFVKKRQGVTKGVIIGFDNINHITVEYFIDNTSYKEECGVMFVEAENPNIINGKKFVRYSCGDEVTVYYDIKKPKRFLVEGSSAFYKLRSFLIFFLDTVVIAFAIMFIYLESTGIL